MSAGTLIALEVLLILAGALGHRPLHRRLGYVPRSLGTTK